MNRAATLMAHGGNEGIVIREAGEPVRKPGETLVRMRAGGLNRVDLYMRDSGAGITHKLPMILGLDGAGVVAEPGEGSRFKAGDPVVVHPLQACGACEFCRRGDEVLCVSVKFMGEHEDGVLADYVSVPDANLFAKPAHLPFVNAAALGVSWLTAWRMIHTKLVVRPWETALIFGVGGSVSLAALEILTDMGVPCIVTSRDEDKLAKAKALGAVHAVSGREDVAKRVLGFTGGRGVDVVIENVGKAVWPSALKSVVRGGRIATCGATTGDDPSADLRRLFVRQIQIFGTTLGTRAEFAALLERVTHRRLAPHIDSVYELDDLHKALNHLESGAQFGKIGIGISAPDQP